MRALRRAATAATFALGTGVATGRAQPPPAAEPILRVEVQDSIGLPLPDAIIEVYYPVEGSKFWEWSRVRPETLPIGVFLLRFSHPGYTPSVFSVPLKLYNPVSLQVRLNPERDTLHRRIGQPHPVRAVGLARDRKRQIDVIGIRRVLYREDIEWAGGGSLREILGRTKLTDAEPRIPCGGQLVVNGQWKRPLRHAQFESLYSASEAEFIEAAAWTSRPSFDKPPKPALGCLPLYVWYKVP